MSGQARLDEQVGVLEGDGRIPPTEAGPEPVASCSAWAEGPAGRSLGGDVKATHGKFGRAGRTGRTEGAGLEERRRARARLARRRGRESWMPRFDGLFGRQERAGSEGRDTWAERGTFPSERADGVAMWAAAASGLRGLRPRGAAAQPGPRNARQRAPPSRKAIRRTLSSPGDSITQQKRRRAAQPGQSKPQDWNGLRYRLRVVGGGCPRLTFLEARRRRLIGRIPAF